MPSVLFLGFLPPVNTMRTVGAAADAETWFPAELLVCRSCHLAQLGFNADPEILFPPDYPYTSGSTRILRDNFANLADEARELIGLRDGELVVDIGSNDGTLLSNFQSDQRVLGVEPTGAGELARERGIETITAFFGRRTGAATRSSHGAARLVTAANVFAHIPDVHGTIDAIVDLLDDDGWFVSESHYLAALVETLQYDTIYHEHLRYYTLTALVPLLEQHGLRVVHARGIPTHGGSIRVYATKEEREACESVATLLERERARGFADESWVEEFRDRVTRSKLELLALLREVKAAGARVHGIGAPSRASTLVNYVGLDDGIVEAVLEVSTSKKLGKYLPGTAIPVLDEEKLYADQPEYALLLSWHIEDELRENLRRKGFRGKFIVPLPTPRVVE